MGPSEVAKVAPPSSGGLFPRIARAEVLLDGRRFEPRSLPPLPPGGTRVPPHPPSGRRFILHTYTKVARSLQQQLLGTSPPWWAVQDLNRSTRPPNGLARGLRPASRMSRASRASAASRGTANVVGGRGLEPLTSSMSRMRSSHLS